MIITQTNPVQVVMTAILAIWILYGFIKGYFNVLIYFIISLGIEAVKALIALGLIIGIIFGIYYGMRFIGKHYIISICIFTVIWLISRIINKSIK